ncbi:MAG: right-handed parallel beta-helix repeat-containing protein [Bacteroidales bacterium]|nr:right-handed parallel beta-helix repeat-containing protein [Bacteroidales bacterium]
MKKSILFTALLFLILQLNYGATNISAGNVSGNWTLSGSPYKILGNITVATGTVLTIQPGVRVEFQGPYRLNVSGKLIAAGNVSQIIYFTKTDTVGLSKKLTPAGGGTGRWNGIFFSFANADTSKLDYCTIEYCNTYEGQSNSYYEQSALTCYYSTLIVSNCLIKNNYGVNAGGIKTDYGNVWILNNTIRNNTAYTGAGGIYCNTNQPKVIRGNTITSNIGQAGGGVQLSQCGLNVIVDGNFISQNTAINGGGILASSLASGQILNNIIVNNTASNGGGIYYGSAGMVLLNNTICNNLASNSGGGLGFSGQTFINAENNIIWGNMVNAVSNNIDIQSTSFPAFTSCLIGGGVASISNTPGNAVINNMITASPLFVNPSAGAGKAFGSSPADWKLTINSPCLNAGSETTFPEKITALDFFMNPRKRFEKIDIGAHEFSQSVSTASGTISSPTLWIADTVKITGNLTVNANLTIAPGVYVQFQGYYEMTLNSSFTSQGTAQNPIIFSIKDTTGFSNKLTTNGRYKGITANGVSGNKISYCIFNYAEHIYLYNSPGLVFQNNLVEKCLADYGFFSISGEPASIKYNTFRNNDNIKGNYYRLIVLSSQLCVFEGNKIYNNNTSAVENYGSNLQFVNNLIYNNGGGVLLERSGYGNLFVNNTFAYNQGGIAIEQGTVKFYNNILYKNANPEIYSLNYVDEMLLVQNIFGNTTNPQAWETFIGNKVIDPMFIKPVTTAGISPAVNQANYGVFSISPVIDKGISNIPGFSFPVSDVYGNTRVNNNIPDIGAFEDYHGIPVISAQPVGGSFCEGQNISISTLPVPSDTMIYQWFKNGDPISGATDKILSISNSEQNDIGNYTCQLSNAYGQTSSYPANITIKAAPSILFYSDKQVLCQNQDLSLEISATGQTPLNYTWQKNTVALPSYTSNRLKITNASTTDAGTYRAVVSNSCGSVTSEDILVSINPIPIVHIGNDTLICANTGFTLDPGAFASYLWNDFTANRFKTVQSTGEYWVKVTDSNGCSATSDSISIQVNAPFSGQHLCMVTVDPETKKNMVVWEKVHDEGISSFNVYKLFGSNFVPIGNVAFGDIPQFIDYSSSPEAVAARYAVSVVDTCGNESAKSAYHQTIHLGASPGIQPNTVVLDWTDYIDESKIFQPDYYYIYRGSSPSQMVLIDSTSGSYTEWNDLNPGDARYYQIQVTKPDPCDPAELLGKKASSGPYIHSLSNLEDNRLINGLNPNSISSGISVYPNPCSIEATIRWSNPSQSAYTIKLYDIRGSILREVSGITSDEYLFKREGLDKGIYIIEIIGEKSYKSRININ